MSEQNVKWMIFLVDIIFTLGFFKNEKEKKKKMNPKENREI